MAEDDAGFESGWPLRGRRELRISRMARNHRWGDGVPPGRFNKFL